MENHHRQKFGLVQLAFNSNHFCDWFRWYPKIRFWVLIPPLIGIQCSKYILIVTVFDTNTGDHRDFFFIFLSLYFIQNMFKCSTMVTQKEKWLFCAKSESQDHPMLCGALPRHETHAFGYFLFSYFFFIHCTSSFAEEISLGTR